MKKNPQNLLGHNEDSYKSKLYSVKKVPTWKKLGRSYINNFNDVPEGLEKGTNNTQNE